MNTTDQQTLANQDTHQADPKGAQLRQTLEHLALQKMIDQINEQDFNLKQLRDILHTCCEHKKADTAQEKIRSTERIAIQRLNKSDQSNTTDPNRARQKAASPPIATTQPPLIGDPNTNQPQQSHEDFCKDLAKAAMDIWGLDISHMCKTDKPLDEETDPPETEDLYDIPPQYRQGATPIQGSQEKHGQPKYTRKEWRKVMFRAIRENYGIYDNPRPTEHQHQPEALARPNTTPHRDEESTPNRSRSNQPAHSRLPLRGPRSPPSPTNPADSRSPLRHLALF